MPSAIKYIAPTDPQRNGFHGVAMQERLKRERAYQRALGYYLDNHPNTIPIELSADGTPLPNDNTHINLVKIVADRTVAFVFPDVPLVKQEGASLEPTYPEELFSKIIEASGGLQFLSKWVLRGFLSGHTFLRITPTNNLPKVTLLQPSAVTVFWRADDVGDVIWYENRFVVGDTTYIEDTVHEGEKWVTYTYTGTKVTYGLHNQPTTPVSTGTDTNIVYHVMGEPAISESPYSPIIDVPHLPHPDDYYGLGEFVDPTSQDLINRFASEITSIVRKNSDPVDVIIGASPEDIELGGNVYTISNMGARVERLAMLGDLEALRALFDRRVKLFLATARVVLLEGEAKDLQRVTNASVRTLFLDALSKNNLLRDSYGRAIKHIVTLALQMLGERETSLIVEWQDPLPTDAKEIADVNAVMRSIGAMSARTASERLGLNPLYEERAIGAEEAKALEKEQATEDKATMLAQPLT